MNFKRENDGGEGLETREHRAGKEGMEGERGRRVARPGMFRGLKSISIIKYSDILGKEKHRRKEAAGQDQKKGQK